MTTTKSVTAVRCQELHAPPLSQWRVIPAPLKSGAKLWLILARSFQFFSRQMQPPKIFPIIFWLFPPQEWMHLSNKHSPGELDGHCQDRTSWERNTAPGSPLLRNRSISLSLPSLWHVHRVWAVSNIWKEKRAASEDPLYVHVGIAITASWPLVLCSILTTCGDRCWPPDCIMVQLTVTFVRFIYD